MYALDTNILVYAHRREAREHGSAAGLLRGVAESPVPWAIPWPCAYEFFSVVTNPRIWGTGASTPDQAWRQLRAWMSSPSVTMLAETPEFSAVLERLVTGPRVRGPIVHDARIAALCLAHGVEALLTRDRDFSMFGELETRDPL